MVDLKPLNLTLELDHENHQLKQSITPTIHLPASPINRAEVAAKAAALESIDHSLRRRERCRVLLLLSGPSKGHGVPIVHAWVNPTNNHWFIEIH